MSVQLQATLTCIDTLARRLHTFTPAHIRTLHPTVREYADQYVEVLKKEREQAEYDILKYKKHIALDIS
jgi:hypothetical protein